MTAWERAMGFLSGEKEESPLWQIAGPLSLLCTLWLAVSSFAFWHFLLVALIGLGLSACWQMRGCVYALVLLVFVSLLHHFLIPESRFWQLGLEISMGFAFFITALAFEQMGTSLEAASLHLQAKEASLQHLEEELAKEQEAHAEQQMALQKKMASLQKELEEFQADQSSLLVLNEVLRRAAAHHSEERERMQKERSETLEELSCLRAELTQQEETLAREKEGLFQELNSARAENEQLRLLSASVSARPSVDPALLAVAEEKIRSLLPMEALYKQLRKQFEEKSEALHRTRSELFHAQTALEALHREQEQKEPEIFPREIEELERELSLLKEENGVLMELISLLTPKLDFSEKRKKKGKKASDQTLLFERVKDNL